MRKYERFKKWKDKFNKTEILDLINNKKLNITEIAKIVDIPQKRLGEMLIYNNIEVPNKGLQISKEHTFFDIIDSEIKAYLLGYFIADGCVSIEPKKRKDGSIYSYNKRMIFTVSIDDLEVMEMYKTFIAPNVILRHFHNPNGAVCRKPQISLKISSPYLVNRLIEMNINPRKTMDSEFVFNFEIIPKELKRHFIRGFMDGDGDIGTTSIGFVSTSGKFLDQIQEEIFSSIEGLTLYKRKHSGITIDWYTLRINTGRKKKKELYDYLYSNSLYYLTRKKIKFNIDNTVLT